MAVVIEAKVMRYKLDAMIFKQHNLNVAFFKGELSSLLLKLEKSTVFRYWIGAAAFQFEKRFVAM